MKKLLSLLLVFVMTFSLAFVFSCNENEDGNGDDIGEPKQAVASAVSKTIALNEYKASMEMNIDMTMSMMGTETTMKIPATSNVVVKNANGEKPEVYTETEMTMMGTTIKTETYCDGEWLYTYEDEEGYKEEVDDAEDYIERLEDTIKNIPEELLESLSFEKVENGYKLTVAIPDEDFATIYADVVEGAAGSLGENMDVTIKNAVVSIIVNDGYIIEYNIEFDMEMQMDMGLGSPADIDAHVVANTTIENPGQSVTITPMDGYQSYPEL